MEICQAGLQARLQTDPTAQSGQQYSERPTFLRKPTPAAQETQA